MDSASQPQDLAEYDGDQNLPRFAALLVLPAKSCRNCLDELPLRLLTRWESATFGGVGREQVHMVLGSVELGQGRPEVRTHLRHELFASVEHLRVEHATAVLGGEHQVGVQVVHDAATEPSTGSGSQRVSQAQRTLPV